MISNRYHCFVYLRDNLSCWRQNAWTLLRPPRSQRGNSNFELRPFLTLIFWGFGECYLHTWRGNMGTQVVKWRAPLPEHYFLFMFYHNHNCLLRKRHSHVELFHLDPWSSRNLSKKILNFLTSHRLSQWHMFDIRHGASIGLSSSGPWGHKAICKLACYVIRTSDGFCHCGDPLSDTGKRRSDASRRQDSKETAGREGGKEGKKKAEWFEESIGASQEIN